MHPFEKRLPKAFGRYPSRYYLGGVPLPLNALRAFCTYAPGQSRCSLAAGANKVSPQIPVDRQADLNPVLLGFAFFADC